MRLLESLKKQLNIHPVAGNIQEFNCDAESGNTCLKWFKSWKDTLRIEFCKQNDSWKTPLLMSKLKISEHTHYVDHISPKSSRYPSIEETVTQLSEIFSEPSSLFSIRYKHLDLVKRKANDYVASANLINREREQLKLRSLTKDRLKYLIFINTLQ